MFETSKHLAKTEKRCCVLKDNNFFSAVKNLKLNENLKFEPSEAFWCHSDTTVTKLTIFLLLLSNVYKFEHEPHSVEENTTAKLNVSISICNFFYADSHSKLSKVSRMTMEIY